MGIILSKMLGCGHRSKNSKLTAKDSTYIFFIIIGKLMEEEQEVQPQVCDAGTIESERVLDRLALQSLLGLNLIIAEVLIFIL